MNRATKKRLMALIIVLTFGLSSVAFVVSGITGSLINTQQFKPLEGYVLEGEINPYVESQYIQNGYTFLKYYYTSEVPEYINAMPTSFPTNDGQIQLIVVKIKSSEDFVTISSINGAKEIKNITQETIINDLCNSLLVTPVECSLMLLQQANITS